MKDDLYTAEQVADYFHVRVETVRDWVKRGILKGFKAGRDWRFTQQNIEDCAGMLQKITDDKQAIEARNEALEAHQPGILALFEQAAPDWPEKQEFEALKQWVLDCLKLNPGMRIRREYLPGYRPGMHLLLRAWGPITVTVDENGVTREVKNAQLVLSR